MSIQSIITAYQSYYRLKEFFNYIPPNSSKVDLLNGNKTIEKMFDAIIKYNYSYQRKINLFSLSIPEFEGGYEIIFKYFNNDKYFENIDAPPQGGAVFITQIVEYMFRVLYKTFKNIKYALNEYDAYRTEHPEDNSYFLTTDMIKAKIFNELPLFIYLVFVQTNILLWNSPLDKQCISILGIKTQHLNKFLEKCEKGIFSNDSKHVLMCHPETSEYHAIKDKRTLRQLLAFLVKLSALSH